MTNQNNSTVNFDLTRQMGHTFEASKETNANTIIVTQTIQVKVISNYPPKPSHGPGTEAHYGNKTCRFQTQRFPNMDYRTAVTVTVHETKSTEPENTIPTKIYSFFGSNIEAANIICLTAHFWSSSHSMTKDTMDHDLLNDIPMTFHPGTLPWMSVDAIEPFPFPTEANFSDGKLTGSATISRQGSDDAVLNITRSISYTVTADTQENIRSLDRRQPLGGHLFNFDPKFKIALEYLHETEVLGVGEFGVVYRGLYGGSPVAVKTTKANADSDYFDALVNEMKVMAVIGEHPNIVKFYGASLERLRERIIHVVVELSPFGDLETYIKTHGANFKKNGYSHAVQTEGHHCLSLNLMMNWCTQIASGMFHLEGKKVVHGDLACRNVLVFSNGVVKLSDFGLSTKLYLYEQKMMEKKIKIPWPWMALESLTHMEFSSMSDAWSFGVMTWEIFSLCAVPYSNYQFTDEFVRKLKNGSLRLNKPEHASFEIYNMMLQCWDKIAKRRPTFKTLENFFRLQLQDSKGQPTKTPYSTLTSNGNVRRIRQKFDYVELSCLH